MRNGRTEGFRCAMTLATPPEHTGEANLKEATPITGSVITKSLNVPERLNLLSILPVQGNLATLRIVRDLREKLSLSEEEHKEFGITTIHNDNGSVTFNWTNGDAALTPRKFQFQPKAFSIIVEALRQLDTQKQLRTEHISLYEAFVED